MKKSSILWILSGVLLLINIIVYFTRWGGENFLTIFSDILPIICSLISSICLYRAYKAFKQFDFAKVAWLMIFIGISLFFIAESIYAILEIGFKLDMNSTFPSIADYFWCGAYVPVLIGLSMMFYGYKNSGLPLGNLKLYGILSIILAIGFALTTYFLLVPIVKDPETDSLAKFFYLYYPIADIFLVIPALILMYITSLFGAGSISKPWKYLAFGFICITLGDLIYSYLSWEDLYGSGNFIDLAWHSGYLLIGLAGLYQEELIKSFNTSAK